MLVLRLDLILKVFLQAFLPYQREPLIFQLLASLTLPQGQSSRLRYRQIVNLRLTNLFFVEFQRK